MHFLAAYTHSTTPFPVLRFPKSYLAQLMQREVANLSYREQMTAQFRNSQFPAGQVNPQPSVCNPDIAAPRSSPLVCVILCNRSLVLRIVGPTNGI